MPSPVHYRTGAFPPDARLATVIAGNGRRATVLGFPALLNLVEGRRVL